MGLWDDNESVFFFRKMQMFIEFSVEVLEVVFEISEVIIRRFIATFICRR